MSETTVCPVCGREYEPEYENREDAPPRSIGREQHQTGICSDGCWDGFMPIADGGTEQDTDALDVGELAEDREQTRDQQDTVVVVNWPGTATREHTIEATGRTVYSHNQQYGYPPDAEVVEAAYVSDMDASLSSNWRDVGGGLAELVRQCDVSTYSFPAPRLARVVEEVSDE